MKFYAKLYFNGATANLFSCSDTLEFTFTANSFEEAIKSYSSYDKSFCIKIDGGYKVINTSSVKYIDIIDEQTYVNQQEMLKAVADKKIESAATENVTENNSHTTELDEKPQDMTHNQSSPDTIESVDSKCPDVNEECTVAVKKRKYTKKDTVLEIPATETKVYVNNDIE